MASRDCLRQLRFETNKNCGTHRNSGGRDNGNAEVIASYSRLVLVAIKVEVVADHVADPYPCNPRTEYAQWARPVRQPLAAFQCRIEPCKIASGDVGRT